jgi:hypothetical protein
LVDRLLLSGSAELFIRFDHAHNFVLIGCAIDAKLARMRMAGAYLADFDFGFGLGITKAVRRSDYSQGSYARLDEVTSS